MSTVFRNALEAHIDQLKHRISGANPTQIADELRMTRELYGRTNDGRVKRSLGNSIRRLESASADAGSFAMALAAPRSLNEPMGWKISSLRKISGAVRSIGSSRIRGVRTATEWTRVAASRTASTEMARPGTSIAARDRII